MREINGCCKLHGVSGSTGWFPSHRPLGVGVGVRLPDGGKVKNKVMGVAGWRHRWTCSLVKNRQKA